jgi:two-component system OmpR family response regulator
MHLLYAADHRVDAYLVKALREAGHVVEATGEPADGLSMASDGDHQAIILDWMGPAIPCVKRFAAAVPHILILVITAAADESERTAILEAGADACFTRPAAFIELEARLAALTRLVRRARPARADPAADMIAAAQAVRLNGVSIALSAREYRVMALLLARPGEVIGLDQLQRQIWGDAAEPRPDLVRTSLSRLRRKLEQAGVGAGLRTVSGHGYVFDPAAVGPDTGGPATAPKMKIV